ncbi:MAG: type II toxin-antitoxin system RelE/ParE family toxin [bacterium]|nr:type II toxin-antitoxin system RelE/ParE family toxin [bacterium]
MDKIRKLFKKLSNIEKEHITAILSLLASNSLAGLDIKKVVGTDYLRIRSGRYRIMFKREAGENVVYEIRLRNENTYKNLP